MYSPKTDLLEKEGTYSINHIYFFVIHRWPILTMLLLLACFAHAQTSTAVKTVSIEKDDDFSGFELIKPEENRLFVLAEHWHNIRRVPRATMKLLRYLHEHANVRIFAIEQGHSSAHMINNYLSSGDTVVLRQIVRNTMFWGKENHRFFQDLYEFNQKIPESERIVVRSIDIEYKMESAIFVINELIADKVLPDSLLATVGAFQQLFEDSKAHREQYNGLAVMYYYDKEFVTNLVAYTLLDLENRKADYRDFFGEDFDMFSTMIKDMGDGLFFDYTNPNTNYKFRDRLILSKFNKLLEENPDTGILCPIGMRHATKGSSVFWLKEDPDSRVYDQVVNIRITALFNKMFRTADLRRINFNFPKQLKEFDATLIMHDPDDPTLRSSKPFDYTIFVNDDGSLTPFNNILKEGY